jgi:hypothetical protein
MVDRPPGSHQQIAEISLGNESTTREDVSLRRVLEREKVKRAGPETRLYQTGGRGTAVILRRTQLQGLQTCLINEQYSQNC